MLLVRQRVDRWDAGKLGELFHVALAVSANNHALHHPSKHTRRVLDRLAAAELNFSRAQEDYLPAQLTNADLEGNSRAS